MPGPGDAKVAELTAKVESVGEGQAEVRFAGKWETAHEHDGKVSYGWASGEGIAQYDVSRKVMRSLKLVLSGAFRASPPYDTADRPVAAVIEWRNPPDTPQPQSRTSRNIEGWKVLVDDRLLAAPDDAIGARALKFLEAKLVEIKTVVPSARVKQLQTIAIVLDLNCGRLGAMQYHPDAGWLKSNGYSTKLAKCVHLPRAADLPTRRNINEQPWVILHELAHGYHDQVLGFDEPRIVAAFEEFKKSGRGEKALLFDGRRVKHYALTDHKEFFAEMTESYFGVNDFFPFNRAELKGAEPRLFELLSQIWNSSEKD
jgi:hypothetical protein